MLCNVISNLITQIYYQGAHNDKEALLCLVSRVGRQFPSELGVKRSPSETTHLLLLSDTT